MAMNFGAASLADRNIDMDGLMRLLEALQSQNAPADNMYNRGLALQGSHPQQPMRNQSEGQMLMNQQAGVNEARAREQALLRQQQLLQEAQQQSAQQQYLMNLQRTMQGNPFPQ